MKNKKLQKWLSELPDDAEVVLSKAFLIKDEKKKKVLYTCRLDTPIVGLVKTKDNKEVCFMINYSEQSKGWGKMRRLK